MAPDRSSDYILDNAKSFREPGPGAAHGVWRSVREWIKVIFAIFAFLAVLIVPAIFCFIRNECLIEASSKGDDQLVDKLLNWGADPNYIDDNGFNSLAYAEQDRRYSTMRLLLHRGADVDATDSSGHTALIRAAMDDDKNAIRILRSAGADATVMSDGCTAYDWAKQGGYKDVLPMLHANWTEASSHRSRAKLPATRRRQ